MPFSFTEIEHKKSSVIKFVFVSLCALYFIFGIIVYATIKLVIYGIYAVSLESLRVPFTFTFLALNFVDGAVILILSCGVAAIHWKYTTNNLIPRILEALNAERPNPQDRYHKRYIHILEELSVATGGRKFSGYVIPSMALNACAACDCNGRAIMAVTEGVLAKLNRSQIEAVMAHEAGHIIRGDSLEASITVSLFDILTELLTNFPLTFKLSWYSLRAGLISIYFLCLTALVYLLLQCTRFAGFILNMFMSRQREFRADAIAARLTRNPLALAEALYIISHSWHGADAPGENLAPLFIVKNRCNALDELDSVFSDLFSTHPPIRQRLSILLDMAHSEQEALESAFVKSAHKPRTLVTYLPKPGEAMWLFHKGGRWIGPYNMDQILAFDWVVSDMLVKKMGARDVRLAWQDPEIMGVLKRRAGYQDEKTKRMLCPHCHEELIEMRYEGSRLYGCGVCHGSLVHQNDLARIIVREEAGFTEEIKAKAHKLQYQNRKITRPRLNPDIPTAYVLYCPHCATGQAKMMRRFYNLMYRIEIDKCHICGMVWFDKDELEMLQFLIEEAKGSS